MNDDANNPTPERSWLERITQLLTGEPKDREALRGILRAAKERELIDAEALEMIEGVLDVAETQVRDIMIPRSQMVTFHQDQSLAAILPQVLESGHSRFPVVGDDRDDILGILLAKDLLEYALGNQSNFNLLLLIRPTTFVPESKRLNVLLKEFRVNRNHMAIVVDEYGGVCGLVTIEDVLEEIVGDIADESDAEEEKLIIAKGDNQYNVNALTPIEDFNAHFNSHLSDAEFDTIGGLVMHRLGHLPEVGETTAIAQFSLTVASADARRIRWLTVNVMPNVIPEDAQETLQL